MPSSTSSSDAAWRRLFLVLARAAAGLVGAVFLFVATIDPFDVLPLSPPLPRVPIASNQRFAYPALARSRRFDSAVIGTSTSRLLVPDRLNAGLDARFVNLAMNAATAYEQAALLDVFTRAHPDARWVVIGLDRAVCASDPNPPRFTDRPFPEWMYAADPWRGYAHVLNLYAIEQAANQFGVMTGIERRRNGLDGYTRFVPEDGLYDLARARDHIAEMASHNHADDAEVATPAMRGVDILEAALDRVAPGTHLLLFMAPLHAAMQPASGPIHSANEACKQRFAAYAAARPGTIAADFLIASDLTTPDDNYWDGFHTRVGPAARLADELIALAHGESVSDARVLAAPTMDARR